MYVESNIQIAYPIEKKHFLFLMTISFATIALFWNYPLYTFGVLVAMVFFFLTLKYPEVGLAVIINGLFLVGIFWRSFDIPYFVTPAAITLCGFALVRYVTRRGLNLKFGFMPAVVIILGLVLFGGIFYSPASEWGLVKAGKYLSMNVFIFFGILLFTGDLGKLKNLLKIIAFIGFVLATIGIFYVQQTGLGSISRLSLPGQNPIWFARGMGLSIISTLFLLELSRKKSEKFVFLVFVFLMLFMVYLTASRGPALSLLISLFFYLFLLQKGWSNFFRKLLYVFLIFSSLKLFVAISPKAIWERMLNLFGGFDLTLFLRFKAYKTAYNLFLKNPLLGMGTGGYAEHDKLLKYPHNIFLELACEHGILIVSLFLIFIAYTFYLGIYLLKGKKASDSVISMTKIFLVLLVFTLLNSQASGALHNNFELWFAAAGIWTIFSTQSKMAQKK